MSTITITENHPQWKLYSQLRKCGELTASPDGRHFGLNCIHCPTIFPWTHIEELLGHLHEKHANVLFKSGGRHKRQQQEQQKQQKSKKRNLCAATSSTVQANTDAADCDSSFREDPLEAVFLKEEEVPCSTEECLVEECPETVEEVMIEIEKDLESSAYLEHDESPVKTQSKNNSENEDESEDEASGFKMDLLYKGNYDVLSYIIEMHAQHTILWDREHTHFPLFKKRFDIYRQMIQEILCRFKMTITRRTIRETFTGLKKLYTEELLYGNEEQPTQLWCFENLDFLRNRIISESKPRTTPIDQLVPLAEIYERYPVLWNLDSFESHNRMRQNAAQHKMLRETNERLGVNMTLFQFRQHVLRMRKYLRYNRRKRLNCEQDGNEQFKPPHEELYRKLHYLEPFIGPHRCDKCGKELLQYHAFKMHVAEHEGRLPFTCDICGKDFKIYTNFEVHVRRHTGEKPFACAYCDRGFPSGTDLAFHERTHTREKNLICHICGMTFIQLSGLQSHKATHDSNRVRFPCPHCPKQFICKRTLKDHLNSHAQVRNSVCPDCGKSFFSSKTLRQHRQLHDKVKRYQCELCHKKFAQKAGLCSHRRTHQIAGPREEPEKDNE